MSLLCHPGLHLVAPFFVIVVVFKLRISWGYVSRLMIGHVGHETISNDNALLCLACLLCIYIYIEEERDAVGQRKKKIYIYIHTHTNFSPLKYGTIDSLCLSVL